jgi:copper homeostasis protein
MANHESSPEKEAASRVLVEVCAGSVADIESAMAAGADQIELCAALELGGLTPPLGLVESALAASPLPMIVMLRPRSGGFCYDRHEFAAMRRDAERFLQLGVAGIAFGILNQEGQIDVPRCRQFVEQAAGRETVFHRAFDFVTDQRAALDNLVDLGCTRVLTSGGAPTALDGAAAISGLVQLSAGRIEIIAGGGIGPENVVEVVKNTGCRQIHIGAGAPADDGSIQRGAAIELCDKRFMQGAAHRIVDGAKVTGTIKTLDGICRTGKSLQRGNANDRRC